MQIDSICFGAETSDLERARIDSITALDAFTIG
jgi:hypothetical protein